MGDTGLFDGGQVVLRVQLSRWVRRRVDLLQHADRNVSINLGGVEPDMAQHRLDIVNTLPFPLAQECQVGV